ncbi:MAG: TonB-dependent receptor plug domain-containing protein [Nitrospira sp.]|nr:TonB-dependent receptor plug domain-containing protein [Nitrospira sp.]
MTLERAQPSGMSLHRQEKIAILLPAAGNSRSATSSSSVKPVVVPKIVVKDVHERNEPDQELVKDIAGTVDVVTREEIQRARPKNADEMLRRVPGVNVLDEYGQGLRPNIGIRGMDPRRSKNILLMLDDILIQPALFGDASTYSHGSGRTHRSYRGD